MVFFFFFTFQCMFCSVLCFVLKETKHHQVFWLRTSWPALLLWWVFNSPAGLQLWKQELTLGCKLNAATMTSVLCTGTEILLPCSGYKFESNFMVGDVQATRGQKYRTGMVVLKHKAKWQSLALGKLNCFGTMLCLWKGNLKYFSFQVIKCLYLKNIWVIIMKK